jgi:hypothetical protein
MNVHTPAAATKLVPFQTRRTFAIIELEDRALSPSAEQFLRFVRDADEAAARTDAPRAPARARARAPRGAR